MKDLLREKHKVEARVARLERDLARDPAVTSIKPPASLVPPPPDPSSDQIHMRTVVDGSAEPQIVPGNDQAHGEGLASNLSTSKVGQSHRLTQSATPRTSSKDGDYTGSDSDDGFPDDSDGEFAMHLLHQEYGLCLYRLRKLQRAIEESTRALYMPMDSRRTDSPTPDPGLDWKSRETHVRSVMREGRKTYKCLDRHLLNAVSTVLINRHTHDARKHRSSVVSESTTTVMIDTTPEPGIRVPSPSHMRAWRQSRPQRHMADCQRKSSSREDRARIGSEDIVDLIQERRQDIKLPYPKVYLEPIPASVVGGSEPLSPQSEQHSPIDEESWGGFGGLTEGSDVSEDHENLENQESSSQADNVVKREEQDAELDDLLRRWTTLYTDSIDEAVSE